MMSYESHMQLYQLISLSMLNTYINLLYGIKNGTACAIPFDVLPGSALCYSPVAVTPYSPLLHT